MAKLQSMDVRQDEFFLTAKLVANQAGQHFEINIQQCRQSANINNIFEQLTLGWFVELANANVF